MLENVQTNIKVKRSQIFFKIAVLFLNIVKKTPMSESLFNKDVSLNVWSFIKKEVPKQLHPCEYCEIVKNSFCIDYLLIVVLFRNFTYSLSVFGYKIDTFYISCVIALFSFIRTLLESVFHGYSVIVFIPNL